MGIADDFWRAILRVAGWPRLIRVDYHGRKEVTTGASARLVEQTLLPLANKRSA